MWKIQIEIDERYKEALDLLKQIIPNSEGNPITDDGQMVEALIDSFMAFIQEQAEAEQWHWDWHCGSGWCGCSH
jgi:predicted ABC-type ATPase